jgi:hypothetical protein
MVWWIAPEKQQFLAITHQRTVKDRWLLVRKQISVGFQFPS